MNAEQAIKANQETIKNLTKSIELWISTPAAQDPKVRAKVTELQDRMLHRLQQLELQGQAAKVECMTTVLALLKGEMKP
jgi:hypothetical protein